MAEDKLVINIDMPIQRGSLISEIKALPKITAPPKKKKEPVPEVEPIILSSIGGKKKKKDKKKKKKDNGLGFLGLEDVDMSQPEDDYSFVQDDNLIDIDAILNREDDDEDDTGEMIIDEQKRSYEKRKKDENPFKKEFAEELTLLYELLDDMNKLSKELDKKYKTLEGSKVRGVSKYTNDHVINMLSAKTSKLQIIKEINNLKKVIADLKIKQDGKINGGAAGSAESVDVLASKYFQNVLKFGRNNFVKEFGGSGSRNEVDDDVDDLVLQIENNKAGYNPDEEEDFQRLIDERLDSENNPFRSNAGTKYIEHENRGVKIVIKRCIDTNDWEFIALDKDNIQVYDYPVPNRREVGKVKFNDNYATDERGRSYKVIEYFLPEYDEDDED
jgi:hypothetical protein